MSEAPVAPADADLLIDTLRGQIARLRRMQFGASSEKLGREIEQLELALEELETKRDAPVAKAAASSLTTRPVPVRSLPDHLPREQIVHEPASGRSDMTKAIGYGTKRWPALSRFLDDGRLEIDNNIAERALRGVAVERRNWLFAGSRAGGERAAAIYTVIQTCKANGIDPQAYITDVIARVADDWPASRWDELMPWNWSPEPARLAA